MAQRGRRQHGARLLFRILLRNCFTLRRSIYVDLLAIYKHFYFSGEHSVVSRCIARNLHCIVRLRFFTQYAPGPSKPSTFKNPADSVSVPPQARHEVSTPCFRLVVVHAKTYVLCAAPGVRSGCNGCGRSAGRDRAHSCLDNSKCCLFIGHACGTIQSTIICPGAGEHPTMEWLPLDLADSAACHKGEHVALYLPRHCSTLRQEFCTRVRVAGPG